MLTRTMHKGGEGGAVRHISRLANGDLRTRIVYFSKSDGKPFRYATVSRNTKPNFRLQYRQVVVRNARNAEDPPTLEAQGFCLRSQSTAFSAFGDAERVKKQYCPEIVDLVRRELGATRAFAFDHVLLSSRSGLATSPSADMPAFTAHNDYTKRISPIRLRELLGEAETRNWRKGRVIQINVWRPFNRVVEETPLALCDGGTLEKRHLVTAELRFEDRNSEFYFLRPSRKHVWWYYPLMSPDELLLIKGYDSKKTARARLAPHAALQLAEVPQPGPRAASNARSR